MRSKLVLCIPSLATFVFVDLYFLCLGAFTKRAFDSHSSTMGRFLDDRLRLSRDGYFAASRDIFFVRLDRDCFFLFYRHDTALVSP